MLKTLALDSILGFHTESVREGTSAFYVQMDQDGFEKAFEFWSLQAAEVRPRLKGLCASPGESSRVNFNLVLELPSEPKVFCIEVDMPRGKPIKNIAKLWPYAGIWMDELVDFSDFLFDRESKVEGVQWRLN